MALVEFALAFVHAGLFHGALGGADHSVAMLIFGFNHRYSSAFQLAIDCPSDSTLPALGLNPKVASSRLGWKRFDVGFAIRIGSFLLLSVTSSGIPNVVPNVRRG